MTRLATSGSASNTLRHFLSAHPEEAETLREAVQRRASFLSDTTAGSPHIEEALVVLAAGGIGPGSLPDGVRAVRELQRTMHQRRVGRLEQLGFAPAVAQEISSLHTPNFM